MRVGRKKKRWKEGKEVGGMVERVGEKERKGIRRKKNGRKIGRSGRRDRKRGRGPVTEASSGVYHV